VRGKIERHSTSEKKKEERKKKYFPSEVKTAPSESMKELPPKSKKKVSGKIAPQQILIVSKIAMQQILCILNNLAHRTRRIASSKSSDRNQQIRSK